MTKVRQVTPLDTGAPGMTSSFWENARLASASPGVESHLGGFFTTTPLNIMGSAFSFIKTRVQLQGGQKGLKKALKNENWPGVPRLWL